MTSSMTTTDIQTALHAALPSELHTHVPALADLLAATAAGQLSPEQAGQYLATPAFAEALRHLQGCSLEADPVQLHFRGDTITVGNIHDAHAIAVGHGALAIKVGMQTMPGNPLEQRNRRRMLARVRDFWVTGVLEASLHGAPMIELRSAFRHQAVKSATGRTIDALEPGVAHDLDVSAIAAKCNQEGCGLLILGAPGAGKTTMLLALTRILLDQAENDPSLAMPVIFNLSTWARKRTALDAWLVEELNLRYDVPHRVAQAWVQHDQILPLLDGLDEVPAADRAACVVAINRFRREHGLIGTVVCCRDAPYAELVGRNKIHLHLNGALLIQPLTTVQIDTYLANHGSLPVGIQAALQHDPLLRELAETPLMLDVITQAYQKLPVSDLQSLPSLEARRQLLLATYVQHMLALHGGDPHYTPAQTCHWLAYLARKMRHHALTMFFVERLQPEVLSGSMLRQYTLFDRLGVGLIAGMLMSLFAGVICTLCLSISFPPQARAIALVNALVFLFVFGLIGGLFGGKGDVQTHAPHDLWWVSRSALLGWLVVGGVAGAVGAVGVSVSPALRLPWYVWGMAFGMTTGLLGLLVGGLAGYPGLHPRRIALVETLNWSRRQVLRPILMALGVGLLYGLIYQLGVGGAYRSSGILLLVGLVFSLLIGFVSWLGGGLTGDELAQKVFPNQGIWRSVHNALVSGLLVGLSTALVVGVGVSLIFWSGVHLDTMEGLLTGVAFGLVYGVSVGIIVGFVFGGYACLSHLMLRLVLWRSGWIPWNYVRFLDHAAERVLLRKVGGGYIFIHRLLMDYFAELRAEKQTAPE